MLISKLVGVRTKEKPSDAQIKSHQLLIRAGFIKSVANGIWTLSMPAKKIALKIEAIIREEMNKIDGQECTFPVVMPKELLEESGRYYTIQEELVRFKDRGNKDMVLGMTHEEAAVHFARDSVSSYQQLPFMIYQIQTKFRDEARSRGGLIRVREFTMKDAYSFHNTQEDLEEYYQKAYDAYNNIFRRIGLKNFVSVQSDSGMMGGNISHEFMLLTDAGEDTIIICPHCGYKANMEVAKSLPDTLRDELSLNLETVFTGDAKEISEVSKFLNVESNKTIKAVCFNIKGSDQNVLCFIRGDLEVNEAKLKKLIKKDIVSQNLSDSKELYAGNIGPMGLTLKNTQVLFDSSLKNANNMVVGANKAEYHIINVDVSRDLKISEFSDFAKVKEGANCIYCKKPLTISGGIEIGNIFQLGTKYTKSMGMTVLSKDGETMFPIMGCYGIGVGRAIAAIAEDNADENGLNWNFSVAPWQVYMCPLRLDDPNVKEKAYSLYKELEAVGIEVLFDDRDVSAGVKFNDCDLMGIPLRLVISPRSLKTDEVEIKVRDNSINENISLSKIVFRIKEIMGG